MPSTEEILINIVGRDSASAVASTVQSNFQSMISSVRTGLSDLNMGVMQLNTVNQNLIGGLNKGKSAGELIFGSSSKADTNKVLLKNMADTQEQADKLYSTVDTVTDNSLTSMQDLIPALNAFKSATGSSAKEIEGITDEMANFGAFVLAQTGSTELAQTAMMNLSKGIKGAYASLDQYGISEDALMRTNKWSGKEDDVKGFMEAVQEVIGSTDELMETNEGLDAQIGKAFSRGGKRIGNEFLPVIKDVKRAFLDLDSELGGNLTTGIVAVSEGFEVMNTALFNINTAVSGFESIGKAFSHITDWAKTAEDAVNGVNNALETTSNMTEIGAGLSEVGAVGAGAGAVKSAGQTEQAINAGIDGLAIADAINDTKGGQKSLDELLAEKGVIIDKIHDLEKSTRIQEDALSQIESSVFHGSGFGYTGTSTLDELEKYLGSRNDAEKSSLEILAGSADNIDDMVKATAEDKTKIADLKKELSSVNDALGDSFDDVDFSELFKFNLDDGLREEIERSDWGVTDAIKNKFSGFKSSITGAVSSIRNFDLASTIKSPFQKMAGSIRGFHPGELLQNALEGGFGKVGDLTRNLSSKVSNIGDSLKNLNIGSKLKEGFDGLDKNLYQSISNFNLKDTLGSLKDKVSGLKGAKEVVDSVEEVDDVVDAVEGLAGAGSAMGAVAPEMAGASVAMEETAVATTTLSGAFTSMIVPLLAISAVIAIMIPIASALILEALVFLKIIQEFFTALNFGDVDLKDNIDGIKQLAEGIAWIGVAMGAMTFASLMTGIAVMTTGFLGITGPLNIAKDALLEASKILSEFSTVTISEAIPQNLEKLSKSLTSVSNAMLSLTSVTVTTGISNFVSWALGFGSVTGALEQAKNDIIQASHKLQEFSNITPLDDATANKIQNVCDSLASVGSAMDGLRSIRDGQNWDDLFGGLMEGLFGKGLDIQQALNNVKDDIIKASNALKNFTGVADIPEDVSGKLKKVADTLTSVGDALKSLRSIRDDGNWDGTVGQLFGDRDIVGPIEQARKDIIKVSQSLSKLKSVKDIDDSVADKLKKVSSTLDKVSKALDAMGKIQTTSEDTDFSEMAGSVTKARSSIIKVSKQLAKLKDIKDIDDGVAEKLNEVRKILGSVNKALTAMNTVNTSTTGVDFTQLTTNVSQARSSIIKVSKQLAKLNEISTIDDGVADKLKSVNKASSRLSTATSTLRGFPVLSGDEIPTRVQKAVTVIQNTARHLNALKGVVKPDESISSMISTTGKSASTLKSTITPLISFPIVSGNEIPNRVQKAVTAVKATATQLNKLKGTTGVSGISEILSSVRTGVSQLRTTLNKMKGGFRSSGVNIGSGIKSGIKSGLNGLGGAVSSKVRSGINSGVGSAKSGGHKLGSSAKTSFSNAFKISKVASDEVGYATQAIQNGTSAFVQAVHDMAQQAVDEAKATAGVESPGYIARMWGDEMGYSAMKIQTRGKSVIQSIRNVTKSVVDAGAPMGTAFDLPSMTSDRLNGFLNINHESNMGKTQRPISIHIGEGAIQLDARNLTTTESRQVMINAIEGLDFITGIDVDGV